MPLFSKFLTRARLSKARDHLGRRILDLGCGHGELLDYLTPEVEQIVLVDRSPERQERVEAKLLTQTVRGQFIVANFEEGGTHFPQDCFDTVVMAALLEHLKDPGKVLQEIVRLLEPQGLLLLTTPTPWGGKIHKLTSFFGLTYREAAEEHVRFYGKSDLVLLLESHGFEIQRFRPFLLGLNQFVLARKKSG
ncbi:MAG: class I SAM-dependent methyltransferase [Terriglobia bacterium]